MFRLGFTYVKRSRSVYQIIVNSIHIVTLFYIFIEEILVPARVSSCVLEVTIMKQL